MNEVDSIIHQAFIFACALIVTILLLMAIDTLIGLLEEASVKWPLAKGEDLDRLVETFGVKRKRWWIFRESDESLRLRVHEARRWP